MKINKPKLNFTGFKYIEKAYTEGIYADSPLNRKLGRVGMTYTAYAEYTQRKKEGEDVNIQDFKKSGENILNKNKAILKDKLKVLDSFNSTTISLSNDHKAFIDKNKSEYNVLVTDKNSNVVNKFTYTSKEQLLNNFNSYLYEADLNISYSTFDKAREEYKVLSSTDTDNEEDFPEGVTKEFILDGFKDYLYNVKNGNNMEDDAYHIITKDGKLISFMGNDGNVDEENPFKSPKLSDITYIEHYGSDDHTFWYNKEINANDVMRLTGYTLKGVKKSNISIEDFSDDTRRLYNKAKKGDIALSDLTERLIENDFPKNDIYQFLKLEFPNLAEVQNKMFDLDKLNKKEILSKIDNLKVERKWGEDEIISPTSIFN
jgi:hypothetical protein